MRPMTERIVTEIVGRIAEETSTEPTDLPPLQETVDVDALDSLVDTTDQIQLTYYNYRVTIYGSNDITIQEIDRDNPETENGGMS